MIGFSKERPILDHHTKAHIHEIRRISRVKSISKDQLPGMVSPMFMDYEYIIASHTRSPWIQIFHLLGVARASHRLLLDFNTACQACLFKPSAYNKLSFLSLHIFTILMASSLSVHQIPTSEFCGFTHVQKHTHTHTHRHTHIHTYTQTHTHAHVTK